MLTFNQFLDEQIINQLCETQEFVSEFLDYLFEKEMAYNVTQPWASDPELKDLMNMSEPDTKGAQYLMSKLFSKYIEPIFNNFESSLKRCATKDAKVLVDTKSVNSIFSKIKRGTKLANMKDILRAAILTKDENDVETVMHNIKKVFNIYQIKDKTLGSDKNWGYYGSHHYIVEFKNVLCEIQVMPKRLWTYKEKGHEIYNKWREKIKSDPNFKNSQDYKKDSAISKLVFKQGNGARMSNLAMP